MNPDVAVIVVTYNLAEHLPHSVRSLTCQTLRSLEIVVVDDCSTDSTPQVMSALMQEDNRVRYIRLEANSGAAGAPRNRGLDEARSPWILFLDGDDVLERHALKNLLLAAESENAEVAAGRTERVDVQTGERRGWYRHIYSERRVLDSIFDYPEFTHDTVANSKLYSTRFLRESGLRFDETLHYEDVLFTAQLYATMGRTVVIPELVYEWRVYPETVRKSITHQRDSPRNLRDRLEVLGRVTEIFTNLGIEEVSDELASKVLRHHARLYLNDMLSMDDDSASAVLATLRPLVEQQPARSFDLLFPFERFLYASVLEGDLAGVRTAVLAERDVMTTGHFEEGPNQSLQWFPAPSRASVDQKQPMAATLRTVNDMRLVKFPHAEARYYHQVTDLRIVRGRIVASGFTADPFGTLSIALASASVILRTERGAELARSSVSWTDDAATLHWTFRMPRPARRRIRERDRRTYDIELRLDDGSLNHSTIHLPSDGTTAFGDASLIGRVLGDRWVTADEPLPQALFKVQAGWLGLRVRRASRYVGRPLKATLRRGVGKLRKSRNRLRALAAPTGPIGLHVYSLLRRLPVRRDTAFFEAHMGTSVSDSPRAVFDEMSLRRPQMTFIWSTPGGRRVPGLGQVKVVQRGSWRYLDALARSQYLVDNQSFPSYFHKRSGQRYLQTWHGIPLKKMGLDEPRNASPQAQQALLSVAAQWDGLVVPNPYFEQTFVPAYGYKGELVRYGTPRCDSLVDHRLDGNAIKRRLEIPKSARVVLYAPTFRENLRSKARPIAMPFDLEGWRRALPSDVVLVVRSHYLNRFAVPRRSAGFVIDGSSVDDVNELYAIADVLVTDYSSVMFDFANTDRPIVIYAYDFAEYVDRSRGTYFDLRADGPGFFVESETDLFTAVHEALNHGAPARQAEFRKAFSGYEDGKSSARAVDFLLRDAR